MKTLFAASILAFSTFAASAQPAAESNTVTITGKERAIVLPESPRAMTAAEFDKYVGSYELANGDSIALFTRAGVKYAALHGGVAHALVARNGNVFVARDCQLAVTIDMKDGGQASGEVLIAARQGATSVAFR